MVATLEAWRKSLKGDDAIKFNIRRIPVILRHTRVCSTVLNAIYRPQWKLSLLSTSAI